VLLVSADFLASDFIATDELPPLLSAAEKEGAVILPVILSPSRFLKTPSLAQFQTVNNPSRPLIGMTKDEQESVLVNVSEAIEASLKHSPEIVTEQFPKVETTSSREFQDSKQETTASRTRRNSATRHPLVWVGVIGAVVTALIIGYWLLYKSEGLLAVHVANPQGQPLTGVVLSATGDSSTGVATDGAGKTRLRLAPRTKPGDEVTLQVVRAPQDLVFISPWNQRVRAHSFEKESQNVAEVVLAKRGDRMLLEYPEAAVAMVSKVNTANAARMGMEPLTDEQRRANLAEAAKAFGFSPEEVDRAIRALGQKTTDPYQLGLVALYAKDYPEATKQLSASVTERRQGLEQAKGRLADAQGFLGQSFYEQGLYREAVSTYQEAAELRPDDDDLLNKLGIALLDAGEYTKAERSLRRRLEIVEQMPAVDHSKLAQSLNNLAMVYQSQGRYEEAKLLYERAIGIWEKQLGPEHLDLASGLNSLGGLHGLLANYVDAERLGKRSLEIREKQLGPDHLDVAKSLNNLAFLYQAVARYDESKLLFERALGIWEKQPILEHPESTKLLNNLAMVYETQGQSEKAEVLFKRVLEMWEKRLGPEHPDVATGLNNLAMVYQSQGKVAEAESLHKRALGIWENRPELDHPDMARSLNNLGLLYLSLNRNPEAEPLLKRALPMWEKHLGPEHPVVAKSVNNLALVYQAQRRYDEAAPLHNRALAIWEKRLGPEHPDTALGLNNLGKLYLARDKYVEAQPLFERALQIFGRYLEPDHNIVIKCISNLAAVYEAQGRYAEAEPLFKRALPVWETRLSHEYISASAVMERYARLLRNTNRAAEAKKLESRARTIRSKIDKNVHKGA
jgi:tetratricopeptide (TPR) repeat protein